MHLVIDGIVERHLSEGELKVAVRDLVALIEMTAIGEPFFCKFEGHDCGPSIVQMLLESHISVHYLNELIWVDIFSCKDFEAWDAQRFCTDRLEIKEVTNVELLMRGKS
ncbi:MAG: S-adenosylmethionine decarboxylase proenzyme [Firmicutes bacterium]|nr:S-adenosylmethionine decarboxylase proenzyme [Bacillota bacterium]